jgi:hypothetical protein
MKRSASALSDADHATEPFSRRSATSAPFENPV